MILKVGMAKAYNRVDWQFLIFIIESFSFSKIVCDLITECMERSWLSIMINDTYKGFFQIFLGTTSR